jgi:hypothetical protein
MSIWNNNLHKSRKNLLLCLVLPQVIKSMKQQSRNFSLTNFVQNFVHQHLLMTRHSVFFYVIMGKMVVYQILILFTVLEPVRAATFSYY